MSEKTAEEIISSIKDIGTCMFTTINEDGHIVARPMAVSHVDDDNQLWFFTPVESDKVDDVIREGRVNLAFAQDRTWISVTADASVITDESTKKELKDLGVKAYFADGAEDPNAALVKVSPDTSQYWEGASKASSIVKMLASSLSDKRPSMGEKGQVEL